MVFFMTKPFREDKKFPKKQNRLKSGSDARCAHLVQRCSLDQLKWGRIYADLLHIGWFI